MSDLMCDNISFVKFNLKGTKYLAFIYIL